MGLPGAIKKTIKKNYNIKIFKLIENVQSFFIFQGLIHEINLIALRSLKIYKSTQTTLITFTMILTLFSFCSSQGILISVSGLFLFFLFFFLRKILTSFNCFFSKLFFVLLIIVICHLYI